MQEDRCQASDLREKFKSVHKTGKRDCVTIKDNLEYFFLYLLTNLFTYFLVFEDSISLCSPDCPGTCCIDQTGFKLRGPPTSAPPKC